MLSRQRIPQLRSRLEPVQAGDQITLSTYVHYSSAPARKTWQKIGAAAAGLAIGSLPHLLDKNKANREGGAGSNLLKNAAPLAGAGVAALPLVLNKQKDKAISKNTNMPKSKNGLFVPDAYLSYTFYDLEGKKITSAVRSIDKHAKDAWQELSLGFISPQDGYVQVEVGNGSKRPVWFEQQIMIVTKQNNNSPQFQTPASHARRKNNKPSKKTIDGEGLDSTEVVTTEPLVQNYSSSGGGYYSCQYTCSYSMYGKSCNYHDCVWVPSYSGGGDDEGGWGPGDGGGGEDDGTIPDPRFMTNNLSPDDERDFLATIEVLERNCFVDAMLDNLQIQPSVQMDPNMSSQSAGGTYNAVTNTIMFRDQSVLLNPYKVNAEIFHAYQQNRTMQLDDIQTSSDFLGGPNVEFEEKFMNIVASAVGGAPLGMADPNGAQGLTSWVLQLMTDHGGNFPTSFSPSEQQQYETFLRGFRQYHVNNNGPAAYRGTIDESPNMLVPINVFDILSRSNC